MSGQVRHFLDLIDIAPTELRGMIEAGRAMKQERRHVAADGPLAGKVVAMIFDKPSTRTRVSFDVAIRQLGGHAIVLTGQEMQLGRGETIADTARVFVALRRCHRDPHSRTRHVAGARAARDRSGDQRLTKLSHPCQIMADLMTFEEHLGPIRGKTVAWSGASNNVLASWMHAAERFAFRLNVATPTELAPPKRVHRLGASAGLRSSSGIDPEEPRCAAPTAW